jgi:polyhydroxyalkanoate synthesis regulator phasin
VPNNETIENPRQLGERYVQELRDLVDEGKITAAFAQRVMRDLFETGEPGQFSLKWSVWCSHIEEQQQLAVMSKLRESSS